uniref:Tripartite motif-containing protein 2 n=1 Tax=Magallana gigas TaxID=29159 RepID=K1PK58_MAGGI
MDPWNSAQDVVRCTLCKTSDAPMYCEDCHINLCKDCEEKHTPNSSIVHRVVSLQHYLTTLSYPKCMTHPDQQCELHCEQCDIPFCTLCFLSRKRLGHSQDSILKTIEIKKEVLHREVQELEKSIYPKYKEMASNISVQKDDLGKISKILSTAINKHGEFWHREIDTIIKNLISKVEEMESKHLVVLTKEEDDITHTISEIPKSIADLKKLLDSKDVSRVSEHKSRNAEFRRLPPKLKVSLPNFRPREINTDQMIEQFGSLSELSFTTEEQDYRMSIQGAESSTPERSLMDEPQFITSLKRWCNYELYGVTCLNDVEKWTRGGDNMIKLYNIWGDLVMSIQTKSRMRPLDIAVTKNGDLVYTDEENKTVNKVKMMNAQIQTVITLQGWKPLGVCSTFFGDLLVIMNSDDYKPTKVVRYSGSIETQIIQYNDRGKPLYSSNDTKYITENKNLDICVSDNGAHAIVVVNQAGKLRFTYSGPPSTTKGSFVPYGITTDSQSRILTADINNHRIHILDQDGQFLRYIDNCYLQTPWGLSVDTKTIYMWLNIKQEM